MEKKSRRIKVNVVLLAAIIATLPAKAQSAEEFLRGNAKFNTVAAVLVLIFVGLAIYLIRLDNKVNKLK